MEMVRPEAEQMESTNVVSSMFTKLQPAVHAALASGSVLLFNHSERTYHVLPSKQWEDERRVNHGNDWHVVKLTGTSPAYFDLDGCGALNQKVLDAFCASILKIACEHDPDSRLLVCDMSTQGHPSFHMTLRGTLLPGLNDRNIACLAVLAMCAVDPLAPETVMKSGGLIVDFQPYHKHFPQMRAVGSVRSGHVGHKVPTHVISLGEDGKAVWENVEDCDLSRSMADCFYGSSVFHLTDAGDKWLSSLVDRAFACDIPRELFSKIPRSEHAAARNLLTSRKKRAHTDDNHTDRSAPVQMPANCQGDAATCVELLSRVLPVVASQIQLLVFALTKQDRVFNVTKSTWKMYQMPNNDFRVDSAMINGSQSFGVCMIKASIPNSKPCHRVARKPLVAFNIGGAMTCSWICPWGSSHANQKSMQIRLTGVQMQRVMSYLIAFHNMRCGECTDLCMTPSEVDCVPGACFTSGCTVLEIRTTERFMITQLPVALSRNGGPGNYKQDNGLPGRLVVNLDSKKRVPDYQECYMHLTQHLDSNMPRHVTKTKQCIQMGNQAVVSVTGFEDTVLLWRLMSHLFGYEPCLGVWISEPDILALLDEAMQRASDLGLVQLVKLTGFNYVTYAEQDGAVMSKGTMIGLKSINDMYNGIKPLIDCLVKSSRIMVCVVNTPTALNAYLRSLREQWKKISVLVIGPWVSASVGSPQGGVRYVNAMPDKSSMSVVESIRNMAKKFKDCVYLVWDAHLIDNHTLVKIFTALAEDALAAPVRPSPSPPYISVLSANHSYCTAEGCSLIQYLMANVHSRVYVCPAEVSELPPSKRMKETSVEKVGLVSDLLANERRCLESVFQMLAVDPLAALSKMADSGLIDVLPLDEKQLKISNPDVVRMCMQSYTSDDLCRYVIPDTKSGHPNLLSKFMSAEKLDPLKVCSFSTLKCVLIIGVLPTQKRTAHLIRILWMVMQPGRRFERVIMLVDKSIAPSLPTPIGPVKFATVGRL